MGSRCCPGADLVLTTTPVCTATGSSPGHLFFVVCAPLLFSRLLEHAPRSAGAAWRILLPARDRGPCDPQMLASSSTQTWGAWTTTEP